MGKSQDKLNRVLAAAQELFARKDEEGQPPVVNNAGSVLGTMLDMPPAVVNVLLRQLHRSGRIGLANGFGASAVYIARTQGDLVTGHIVATKGGNTKVAGSVTSHYRARGVEVDAPEPTEEERLQTEIERLGLEIKDLNGKLEKSARHLATANSEREDARRAQRAAEEKLGSAQITIRRLEAEVATYRDTAERRIRELEAELEVVRTQSQNALKPEVLEELQRLRTDQPSD